MRPRRKPRNSHADHAKLQSSMTFSPSAAVLFGLKPHSVMRPLIASSTMMSMIKALRTSASCELSNRPGGAPRSRAEMAYNNRPSTDKQQVEEDEHIALDVDAVIGPGDGYQEGQQRHREKRGEDAGQHRRHVLDDALLGFYQPCGRDDRGHGATWQQPRLDELLGVKADRSEGAHREGHEHAATQSNEDEVDQPLPREPDEVHPPPV